MKIINFLNKNGIFVFENNNKLINQCLNYKKYNPANLMKVNSSEFESYVNDNNYLKGPHNLINASIAVSIARKLNINDKYIKLAIKSFKGLPHRMEPIYISDKIEIINDSKSTNGESTAVALESFNNVFWIVGGEPKSSGIGRSKNFLHKVVEVFLIGNSINYFAKEISKANKKLPLNNCSTLEKATKLALKKSITFKQKKCVILLSPSAASFDQFKNFEDRGNKFRIIVDQQLKKGMK